MARGRFVTNTLGDSEKFSVLKSDTHRTAYILLVTWADAEGRFLADPVTLKGKLYTRLPWTPDTVEAALLDMHDVGLIHLYNVNGKRYGSVDKFHEHNKIYRKPNGEPRDEAPSRIPAPPEGETRPAPDEPTSNPRVTRVQPEGNPRATHVEVEVKGKGNGSTTTPPTPPRGKARKRADFNPANAELPQHVDPTLWLDFVKHRSELRKRLTPTATQRLLAKLERNPRDANTMLRASIENGWQGVFEPKNTRPNPTPDYAPATASDLLEGWN
jgi:hypothetical protein